MDCTVNEEVHDVEELLKHFEVLLHAITGFSGNPLWISFAGKQLRIIDCFETYIGIVQVGVCGQHISSWNGRRAVSGMKEISFCCPVCQQLRREAFPFLGLRGKGLHRRDGEV